MLGFQLPASLIVVFALDRSYERLWQVVAITYVSFAIVYALYLPPRPVPRALDRVADRLRAWRRAA